jgi:hypothetical protein
MPILDGFLSTMMIREYEKIHKLKPKVIIGTLCIYMYSCIYVFKCIRQYTWNIHVFKCICQCIYIGMSAHLHIYVYIRVYDRTPFPLLLIHTPLTPTYRAVSPICQPYPKVREVKRPSAHPITTFIPLTLAP